MSTLAPPPVLFLAATRQTCQLPPPPSSQVSQWMTTAQYGASPEFAAHPLPSHPPPGHNRARPLMQPITMALIANPGACPQHSLWTHRQIAISMGNVPLCCICGVPADMDTTAAWIHGTHRAPAPRVRPLSSAVHPTDLCMCRCW